jgi:hypothetical protein
LDLAANLLSRERAFLRLMGLIGGLGDRCDTTVEMLFDRLGQETGELGVAVPVAESTSTGVIVTLRVADGQMMLSASQRDVE